MEKIVHSFLKHTYLFQLPVRVVAIKPDGDGRLLEFNDTIFHPQGGGQPNDVGKIVIPNQKEYPILSCINDRDTGKIWYKVAEDKEVSLEPGSQVLMVIDQETRKKNARLHSAGHLLDVGVNRLKLDWRPGKGYHFQDSPYVEYIGVCEDNQKVKEQLQKEIDDLLVSSPEAKVEVQYLGVHQAIDKKLIDETFKGDNVRMVNIMGVECPCGGTHVEKVAEVGRLLITKIAKKGKNIRVSYSLPDKQ